MDHAQLVENLKQIKLLVDECLQHLAGSQRQPRSTPTRASKVVRKAVAPDFSLPVRPFIKKYAIGMSGPKKFTLLVARLAGGDARKEISLVELEKAWSSMTALMGMKFNRFFSQQAKDNDWVETKKKGVYTLRPSWVEILKHA